MTNPTLGRRSASHWTGRVWKEMGTSGTKSSNGVLPRCKGRPATNFETERGTQGGHEQDKRADVEDKHVYGALVDLLPASKQSQLSESGYYTRFCDHAMQGQLFRRRQRDKRPVYAAIRVRRTRIVYEIHLIVFATSRALEGKPMFSIYILQSLPFHYVADHPISSYIYETCQCDVQPASHSLCHSTRSALKPAPTDLLSRDDSEETSGVFYFTCIKQIPRNRRKCGLSNLDSSIGVGFIIP